MSRPMIPTKNMQIIKVFIRICKNILELLTDKLSISLLPPFSLGFQNTLSVNPCKMTTYVFFIDQSETPAISFTEIVQRRNADTQLTEMLLLMKFPQQFDLVFLVPIEMLATYPKPFLELIHYL